MILRTPPPSKRPRGGGDADGDGNGQLVIYEDPPESSQEPSASEHMLCTYQCRQMVKSDFIEALNKAENQARDYQSKFETLEDNFQKVESERKKFVDQFLYAEQELAAAKGREQALQEQLLKEVTESQERLRKQIQLNSELQLEQMECRANNAEREAELLKEQLKHLKGQLDE